MSGALRRSKSLPPPDLDFVSCCLDGVVHGTPEGCSRCRYTDVYGVRFVLKAGVRLLGVGGSHQKGRLWCPSGRPQTADCWKSVFGMVRLRDPSWTSRRSEDQSEVHWTPLLQAGAPATENHRRSSRVGHLSTGSPPHIVKHHRRETKRHRGRTLSSISAEALEEQEGSTTISEEWSRSCSEDKHFLQFLPFLQLLA